MTVAEFARIVTPEHLLRLTDNATMELVDGHIVEKNGSAESSEIEGIFCFRFQSYLATHPVAKVYSSSLGYQCFPDAPDKVRKPDMTLIRMDRVRSLPDPNPGYMPIVPDLAVEVISLNDTVYDVDQKVEEYLSAGFPLVWVADPRVRTITVYPMKGKPVIYTADDELTLDTAAPGFRCKVAEFFPL